MDVLRRVADARAFRASVPGSLGFVPTLGALHAGHGSLVERAVRERAAAIASLFVNPTQFAPGEDLAAYPRREAEDLAFLERLGCSAVFVPSVEEMYPPGDDTRVQPGEIAARLEGAARPGHLTGVATVVTKLFAVVRPDVAYFGQKDFQQLRVVQALARDLRLGVRVVGCPTVRDEDGLALSSRNAYLSADERRAALALPRGLFAARADRERGAVRQLVSRRVTGVGSRDAPPRPAVVARLGHRLLRGRARITVEPALLRAVGRDRRGHDRGQRRPRRTGRPDPDHPVRGRCSGGAATPRH